MTELSHIGPKTDALLELLEGELGAALEASDPGSRDAADVRELAEDATLFIACRRPGALSVRVHNPGGLRAGRTVVEALLPDQPFVVDTLRLCFGRLELRERVLVHPVIPIDRDEDGNIAALGREAASDRESYVYMETGLVESQERRNAILRHVTNVLELARGVVADHGAMVERLEGHLERMREVARGFPDAEERMLRPASFLEWLERDGFVFLGYREYAAAREDATWSVSLVENSGLGVLRDPSDSRFVAAQRGHDVPPLIRSRLAEARMVFFDKSRTESIIHRTGRLDAITVRMLDREGNTVGFGRFVGQLTHKALRTRATDIPLLERRCREIADRISPEPGSHSHKLAVSAYESLPLEFLFPFDASDVERVVRRVIRAAENRKLEVSVVPDPLSHAFFLSVALPRPLYDEELRRDLRSLIESRTGANYVDHRSSFLEEETALIHYFCSGAQDLDDISVLDQLETDIRQLCAQWQDGFEGALLERHAESDALRLSVEYTRAFSAEYRRATRGAQAAEDVDSLETLRRGEASIDAAAETDADGRVERIRVYAQRRPYLTDLLPVMDAFGVRVVDATLSEVAAPGRSLWIVTFRTEDLETDIESGTAAARVLDGLRAALAGKVECDALGRLILGCGLDWREVDLLRALHAYTAQIGTAPELGFAAETLRRHPEATRALVALFDARFDPEAPESSRDERQAAALAALGAARAPIASASEDGVFEVHANLIQATLRTNYFAIEADRPVHELVFKIRSRDVQRIPQPVPFAEIFVHSAEMSGIHLRGGRVARGGLRWSDRPLDFRAEVLGLMKAQMVKNGLIVPVGSKGGFVLKRMPADRARARTEADRVYARFIRGLLAVTDSKRGGAVVPPEHTVRHDGDDPYLVVAADKGTAHLSDVANAVANDCGFWLGDAFASGGSAGYDHKVEGITARGAWVNVCRHFLESGTDITRETFTIAGIGDMSGDVFGNGMLLARTGKLLAAFNHMHIFVDPDPDPDLAWRERKRLFETPGSTWKDYDDQILSDGGGVFERGAKQIKLTPQMRRVLDVSDEALSADALVRAILCMPVDLLWNGGIGTYVKSSAETDHDAGDRASDAVRVNASQLRAKVIGEGGNLGLTQRARIEFALGGGRVNTDALDNSAGVDLSDHEVNFKLMLAESCESGRLDIEERNRVLADCVKDADESVLANNATQSRCVTMDQIRSWRDPERMSLAGDFLQQVGGLDPALEFLPDREAVRLRANLPGTRRGWARPEVAVLLGYTKMSVKRELVKSEIPDREELLPLLRAYFPDQLRTRFANAIDGHPLRREITATALCNYVIDRAGVTLVPELARGLGASAAQVVAAYWTADQLLRAEALRDAIEAADIGENLRLRARLHVEDGVRMAAAALLGLEGRCMLDAEEGRAWGDGLRELEALLPEGAGLIERAALERAVNGMVERGLPVELATPIESLPVIVHALGALTLAMARTLPLTQALETWVRVGEVSRIDWLLAQLDGVDRADAWQRVCAEGLHLEMLTAQRNLSDRSLVGGEERRVFARARLRDVEAMAAQIEAEGAGLASLTVLSQQIRRLTLA